MICQLQNGKAHLQKMPRTDGAKVCKKACGKREWSDVMMAPKTKCQSGEHTQGQCKWSFLVRQPS